MIAALVMGLMKAMAEADINWFQSCQIFGIKSGMDPWNFRIVFRNVSVCDSDHCSWRSPWDDLYDRCNDELSEYEERYDRVCCVDHYIGRNIHIIFCFERVCFIITDQQWRVYNQFFK